MEPERLEVRLDSDRRQKLHRIAETRGLSVSYTVRELIDQAFEDCQAGERLQIVERLAGMSIEDVPEPDELARQLDSTYDVPDLH
jgi:hypothetical protein